jgi:hypothetical protein
VWFCPWPYRLTRPRRSIFHRVLRRVGGSIEEQDSRSSHRDELIKVVQEADQANASVQSQAQQIVADARLTRDLARPVKQWACSQSDDSALSSEAWQTLIGSWVANCEQARRLSLNLTQASTFSGTTLVSALSTSVHLEFDSVPLGNPPPAPIAELRTILQRAPLFDEAIQALTAFGLQVGFTGSRSATELLTEAHGALMHPSGPEVAAASALIPARESIDAVLAALLRRRPQQEEAKSGKVVSIGGQCRKDGFDADHFLRLEANLAILRKRLSEAKQQRMARGDVSAVFNEVLLFLIALLKCLDATKMR